MSLEQQAVINACAIAGSDIMESEEEIIKNKGKIKILELKLKALINILTKEGITSAEEVEEELSNIIEENG